MHADAQQKISQWEQAYQQNRAELEALWPYREVRDAHAESHRLRHEAEQYRQAVVAHAQQDAAAIRDNAMCEREEALQQATALQKQADDLHRTSEAIRNAIEGYGDEYLLPAQGLLDELGEEYEHAQAGQELKEARKRSRQMLKEGLAAACDYVEAERRKMAIHFVIHAFNGEVDAILAKVKHDNWGTLQQQVRDAFETVNFHGAAFRNARILPDYLYARLEELRWASAAQQLKLREKEEQRQIQAQMREEERARREYEKTIRAAEKDERLLQEAMAKAKRELEAASAAERQVFEGPVAELQQKLAEAEAKHQRAESMAQQTRRGHVYVISNIGSFGENVFKIGMTRRLEPSERVKELGDASVPFEFDVHAMIYTEDAPALERELQKRFELQQVNKVNPRKEFFAVDIASIKRATDELGVQVAFTLKAAAREYRESLAIARKNAAGSREGVEATVGV